MVKDRYGMEIKKVGWKDVLGIGPIEPGDVIEIKNSSGCHLATIEVTGKVSGMIKTFKRERLKKVM